MRHGINFSKKDCPSDPEKIKAMSQIPYASAIGSIMYAMLCTRPDVAFALSVMSSFQSNPGDDHWIGVKNIIKFLRRTKDEFLIYGGGDLRVRGYTDSSFQSDPDDSRSTSGFVFILNGGAVWWKSSKQLTTADSTTEAKYITAAEAAKEAVWMKKFIQDLGVVPSIDDPIPMLCDNTGAVAQSKDPIANGRARHVLRRFHLIREIIERKDIEMEY